MPQVRVRHASFYVGGKKIATMHTNSYTLSSGDENQFGDEGWVGMSDGAGTTTCSAELIVPTKKSDATTLINALTKKQYLDIAFSLIDGGVHQMTMRCTEADFKSDAKSGTLAGTFKFNGGVPTIVSA